MTKTEFLKMLKKALKNKLLEYTTITSRYYLTVPEFGGVTIATYFSLMEKVHKTTYITPYADTGFMDKLSMELPIPSKESKEYYKKWGKESDDWINNPKNNIVPQEGHLEELTSTLTIFAIDNYLTKKEKKHAKTQ